MQTTSAAALPAGLAAAHAMIHQLIEQLMNAQRENAQLEHQLQQLMRRPYGRSSEQIDPARSRDGPVKFLAG